MNIWNSLPFARILIAFLAGIIISINVPELTELNGLLLLIPLPVYYFFSNTFRLNYKLKFLKGIPIVLFFFLFGIKLVHLHSEIKYTKHFSKTKPDYFLVRITEPPKIKANTLKIAGEVIQVREQNKWKETIGKLLIYMAKDQFSSKLKYGNSIFCKANITEAHAPKNPFEFNYRKYLAFHQIHHQTYLNKQNWIVTSENAPNVFFTYAYQLRNYFLHLISNSAIDGDEYAIGSALILGYEDDLTNEVIGSFAATGALHVLSVSGLHVGIVFLVVNFLLQYLGESKTAKISSFIISIGLLWLYALITGLSPSVCRAAAMFSLISFGKFYKKDISTFNIIACSAFILLCINPFMITEVGFQLSYLAVIGIVTLHHKFYELLSFKNKLIDSIWTISCVSIAAQLVTFPLGLLYFHQFPNYFLFSNLLIIPLSTIILYGGILLLAVAKIPIAGALVAKVLYGLLWLLKSTVSFFENLPYAIIEGIAITTYDTFIIYGILIGLYSFWLYKKLLYFKLSIVLCMLLISMQIIEKFEQKTQEKIIVYAINKHFAVDFIAGENNVFIADSTLLSNKDKIRFHLKPNWDNLGLSKSLIFNAHKSINATNNIIISKSNYLFFHSKVVLNACKKIDQLNILFYKPEIVLLNISNKSKFKALFKLFPQAKFICDGTISAYLYQSLKKNNPYLNLRSVMNEGAITIEV
jgi:competence protein ComEC